MSGVEFKSGMTVPEPDLLSESCDVTGGGTVAVTRNVVLAEAAPSPTVIVTSANPPEPATGVTVTVRLELLPANTMFVSGTIAALDEMAESESSDADVSTSPIVKAIGPLFVSETIVTLAMGVIVGALFTEVTVTANVRTVVLFTDWRC